jgi:pilus assembly protein CpaE
MPAHDQIRLLLVEDVPQVAQYIRNLLNTQALVKLVGVVTEGARAATDIAELRPDIVLVDALLQGRMKAPAILAQLRKEEPDIPLIVLTVPQTPMKPDSANGIFGVLTMPFSGYDLLTTIQNVRSEFESGATGTSGLIAVFSPKGGVGKTTLAFNLAVQLQQLGATTVLIDGNVQFGDLRGLLKVPGDVPSILDLPTDRVAQSDLHRVLWRDPSGIDILLAPPRVEMAEMLSARDVEKVLSILRRVYPMIVVDLSSALNDVNLVFLDHATAVLLIVTAESTTIHNVAAASATFKAIGYPEEKIRYLVNRSDAAGNLSNEALAKAIGRHPDHVVPSDGRLVVASNNDGVPFVLAQPDAPISRAIREIAADLLGMGKTATTAAARR